MYELRAYIQRGGTNLERASSLRKTRYRAQSQLAARFAIRSIPTMKIFKQGKEIASISGALPKQQFQQWLTQNL
ncbi:hypothetical protein JCM19236_3814 [Vibrio sp. JCM 19236]|nr:hypothetical protein JCM19236_3814 [Vibrio sp. JCM 19236]